MIPFTIPTMRNGAPIQESANVPPIFPTSNTPSPTLGISVNSWDERGKGLTTACRIGSRDSSSYFSLLPRYYLSPRPRYQCKRDDDSTDLRDTDAECPEPDDGLSRVSAREEGEADEGDGTEGAGDGEDEGLGVSRGEVA